MANRERGEVELAFGDERYTLRMSINAVAEIEDLTDKGINDLIAMIRDPANFRVSTWRVMLWGGLRQFHPCSLEEAGEIMGRAGVDLVVNRLGEALAAAFPESKGKAENPQSASREGGEASSRTGA